MKKGDFVIGIGVIENTYSYTHSNTVMICTTEPKQNGIGFFKVIGNIANVFNHETTEKTLKELSEKSRSESYDLSSDKLSKIDFKEDGKIDFSQWNNVIEKRGFDISSLTEISKKLEVKKDVTFSIDNREDTIQFKRDGFTIKSLKVPRTGSNFSCGVSIIHPFESLLDFGIGNGASTRQSHLNTAVTHILNLQNLVIVRDHSPLITQEILSEALLDYFNKCTCAHIVMSVKVNSFEKHGINYVEFFKNFNYVCHEQRNPNSGNQIVTFIFNTK